MIRCTKRLLLQLMFSRKKVKMRPEFFEKVIMEAKYKQSLLSTYDSADRDGKLRYTERRERRAAPRALSSRAPSGKLLTVRTFRETSYPRIPSGFPFAICPPQEIQFYRYDRNSCFSFFFFFFSFYFARDLFFFSHSQVMLFS